MFWIYVPPIILVVALAALAVVVGRKSSEIKRMRVFDAGRKLQTPSTDWKGRLNSLGRSILHLLEKLLVLAKNAFRKTEQSTSVWAARLRARRNGRKFEGETPKPLPKEPDEINFFQEIERTEEISTNLTETGEGIRYAGAEVVVRRKITEEPVVVPKKEPMPEDKVREAALIYRIAENPKDLEAYREIGDYYLGIGNIKDAKEAFKMVLKLRPRDLKAKSSLREIEMRMRLGS